jgi:hypothetical protein
MFLEKAGVIGDPQRRIGGRQRGEGELSSSARRQALRRKKARE